MEKQRSHCYSIRSNSANSLFLTAFFTDAAGTVLAKLATKTLKTEFAADFFLERIPVKSI